MNTLTHKNRKSGISKKRQAKATPARHSLFYNMFCFLRYKISCTALRVALRDKAVMPFAICRFLLMAAPPVLYAMLHCVAQSIKPGCCPYWLACW